MNQTKLFLVAIVIMSSTQGVFAAHYIVGIVEDARDTTSANGRTVVLWNTNNGLTDNLTDIVGPTGNSGTDKTYLIDCELLSTPCSVGDPINITLLDNGSGYVAIAPANITVTGAGFDVAPNVSINTPPQITNWTVEDQFTTPPNELDLSAASSTSIYCNGIVTEHDGIASLQGANSELFSRNSSFYGDTDDNNHHYSNNSCTIDTSYGGPNEAFVNCTYSLQYYANPESWSCMVNLTDTAPVSVNYSDETVINQLLAVGVNDSVDFGEISPLTVSNETLIEVINYGNVQTNLSLSGYAFAAGDGNAMQCGQGNISVEDLKYNITSSNAGQMNLSQATQYYTNLSSSGVTTPFNLGARTNDALNDATNFTYWRIYVPLGVDGTCNGNIVMGATQN